MVLGQTSDGQTSDGTNVGRKKLRTKTNVGPRQTSDWDKRQTGQTSDQDKRRTGTNIGPRQTSDRDKRWTHKKNAKFLEAKYSFRTKIIPIKTTSYYVICM